MGSEEAKSELGSVVPHELRTPLASVLGFTSVLLQREVAEEQRLEYLEIIEAQGRRLSALVNDFLDVQRLEEGQLSIASELVDVSRVVREQSELFAGQSPKHLLDVSLPPTPLPVRGDSNRLAQVVANLVSNAIKYSPSRAPAPRRSASPTVSTATRASTSASPDVARATRRSSTTGCTTGRSLRSRSARRGSSVRSRPETRGCARLRSTSRRESSSRPAAFAFASSTTSPSSAAPASTTTPAAH